MPPSLMLPRSAEANALSPGIAVARGLPAIRPVPINAVRGAAGIDNTPQPCATTRQVTPRNGAALVLRSSLRSDGCRCGRRGGGLGSHAMAVSISPDAPGFACADSVLAGGAVDRAIGRTEETAIDPGRPCSQCGFRGKEGKGGGDEDAMNHAAHGWLLFREVVTGVFTPRMSCDNGHVLIIPGETRTIRQDSRLQAKAFHSYPFKPDLYVLKVFDSVPRKSNIDDFYDFREIF